MKDTPNELRRARTTLEGTLNKYKQPLYDYQTYAAAGQSSLQFFAVPRGQAGKTYSDTNMEQASQLPAPQRYKAESLEVVFFPGAANTVATFGAQTASKYVNDVVAVYTQPARLTFTIGQMNYAFDGPLMMFPPKRWMDGFGAAADATTAGAAMQSQIGYATAKGEPFKFEVPGIEIPYGQNFSVTIHWDNGAVALPSAVAGRIGVRLGGWLFRGVQ